MGWSILILGTGYTNFGDECPFYLFGYSKMYHSFISDSRLKGLSIRNLKIIGSNTIQLFSEIQRGVGRNRLDGARKKGGFKVHAMMDAFSGVTEFVRMTEASYSKIITRL